VVTVQIPDSLPPPAPAPAIPPLAVMGIGSWPRPRWMLAAIHDHVEGRLGDEEFAATAEDAMRLAVAAQVRAGVDVVTDGEVTSAAVAEAKLRAIAAAAEELRRG
jgi:5-methyltetrahydropteroyltriglutamate--homocysteine methyltransferase